MNLNISFRWRKGLILSATFFASLFLLTVSCKKKDNLLGGNVLDQNDLLNSGGIDTFSLTTYSIETDSVISSNPRYALLGNYIDPEFGSVKTGFYTQVRLQGLSPTFEPGTVVDSVVLALEYVNQYGPNSTQTFEVYRVNEQMYFDSNYYNTRNLNVQPTNLVEPGYGTLELNENNLTVVGNDTLSSQLRIRLKNSVGSDLITDRLSGAFDTEFADDDLFANNYFKGIYVKTNGATSTSGSVGYFNLVDQDSKIIIYFTDGAGQKSFDLRINDKCASFNHVEINNSGNFVQTVLDVPSNGQTEFFAQAYKSRAIVDVTSLVNLPDNIVVHAATLYLPVQHNLNSRFTPPNSLAVLNAESLQLVELANYSSSSGEYAIDLRKYIQEYLSGKHNNFKLQISPSAFISSVDRVVFNGPLTTNKKKPRLIISYTEF